MDNPNPNPTNSPLTSVGAPPVSPTLPPLPPVDLQTTTGLPLTPVVNPTGVAVFTLPTAPTEPITPATTPVTPVAVAPVKTTLVSPIPTVTPATTNPLYEDPDQVKASGG